MKQFKNILYVAEGTTREKVALSRAMELAALNHAKLTVIDVVRELSNEWYNPSMRASVIAIQKKMISHRAEELEKLVKAAAGRKRIKPVVRVLTGTNFIEIIQMVVSSRHDLVIKLASGKTRLSSLLFGSLDLHLLRKCPCPVWIIRPRRKISHSRILAAVDVAPEEQESSALNTSIMDLAGSLARFEKGELHVLNVWNVPGEARLNNSQLRAFKSLATLRREFHDLQKHNFDRLLERYSSCKPQAHMIKGEAATVIPRFVNNHGIDLMVMGTLARSGIAGLFIGNTAEKILNSVHCSVLALKPAGFETPVRQ